MARKILLVDDDKVNIALLKFTLAERNYEVVSAFSGPEGLSAVKEETPDLVILDIHMPGMSGYEFMGRLNAMPGKEPPPVIMLTGQENYEDMFILEGVKAYFRKPVDSGRLFKKIEDCLGRPDFE